MSRMRVSGPFLLIESIDSDYRSMIKVAGTMSYGIAALVRKQLYMIQLGMNKQRVETWLLTWIHTQVVFGQFNHSYCSTLKITCTILLHVASTAQPHMLLQVGDHDSEEVVVHYHVVCKYRLQLGYTFIMLFYQELCTLICSQYMHATLHAYEA